MKITRRQRSARVIKLTANGIVDLLNPVVHVLQVVVWVHEQCISTCGRWWDGELGSYLLCFIVAHGYPTCEWARMRMYVLICIVPEVPLVRLESGLPVLGTVS